MEVRQGLELPLSPTQPANAPPSFLPPTRAMKMEWKMPGGNNNSSQASQVEAVFPSVSHPAPHPSHPLSTLHHPSHSPTPASFRLMALLIDAARNLLKIKRTETKKRGRNLENRVGCHDCRSLPILNALLLLALSHQLPPHLLWDFFRFFFLF